MHAQPVFQNAKYVTVEDSSVSMELFNRGVCLPSDTKTDLADIDRICSIIKSLF
jgi:dTDP-4-amino-4,6-dideoxygalactose transaminase